MKKLFLLVAIVCASIFFYQRHQESLLNPEVIAHPTYAEIHMTLDARNRVFEQVLFAQTVDQKDCKKYADDVIEKLMKKQASDPAGRWVVSSSECKNELAPRHARLFENKPTFVTYLSMARGDRREREARLIYWGVSSEESDRVCDGVSQLQSNSKGTATCIRAIPQ